MLPSIPRRNDGSNLQDWNPPHRNLRPIRQCDVLRHLLTDQVLDPSHDFAGRGDATYPRNRLPCAEIARLGMVWLGSLYVR